VLLDVTLHWSSKETRHRNPEETWYSGKVTRHSSLEPKVTCHRSPKETQHSGKWPAPVTGKWPGNPETHWKKSDFTGTKKRHDALHWKAPERQPL